MTEGGPDLEGFAKSQVRTSLEYAFDPTKPKKIEQIEARNRAAEEAGSFIDRAKGELASLAAEIGIPQGTTWAKETKQALWASAASNLERRLGNKLERGKMSKVLQTLDEIDPEDTELTVNQAPPSYPARVLMVRASMGLAANQSVDLLRGRFAFQHGNPERIIIGGQSFFKRAVRETIGGSRNLKPMYDLKGEIPQVLLPLINPDSGKTQIVMVPLDRLANLKEQLFSLTDIAVSAYSLASPDHGLQDRHDRFNLKGRQGQTVIRRFVVADGSGGSLKHIPGMNQATQDRLIGDKVAFICGQLRRRSDVRPEEALEQAHQAAMAPKQKEHNPAYATVAVVDLSQEQVEIATMGDASVVAWSQEQQPHRRSSKTWSPENLSGPSNFQLLTLPQNMAQAIKAGGLEDAAPTQLLDIVPEANQIYAAVGDRGKPNAVIYSQEELKGSRFLLIASDGAQPNGSLLDPDTKYSQDAHKILSDLAKRSKDLKPEEAAKLISQAAEAICKRARQIPGENDDITVMIVDLGNWT